MSQLKGRDHRQRSSEWSSFGSRRTNASASAPCASDSPIFWEDGERRAEGALRRVHFRQPLAQRCRSRRRSTKACVGAGGFVPQHAEPGRAILFLHGGGYVQGSAKAYRGFVSQIVSRARIPALVIDYPLAPKPRCRRLRKQPGRPGDVAGRPRLRPNSDCRRPRAGGGLTLVTLAELTRKPYGAAPIAGVVFSPWADLAFTGASMKDPAVADPLIGYDYLQELRAQISSAPRIPRSLASPLFGDLRGLPPLLIQVGTDERLLDDARQYAARATQAGVSVELEIFEGMHHVFQLDVAHLESSRAALDSVTRFLRNAFDGR